MIEKAIEIQTADGPAGGYLYQPEAAGSWPGVIHLTDIGGIRAANRDWSMRLSAAGYLVLLPNIFFRSGAPPLFTSPFTIGDDAFMKRVAELRQPMTPEAMDRDGSAYVDFLAAQETLKPGGFGILGFCFSSSMAMRIAAARPEKIAALASFHGGGLCTDAPASPHLLLPRVKARLYFGHASEDRSMPKEAIERFEGALRSWGGKFESETYDARHGWTMRDMPVYNQPQAERAFSKLTGLFAATLP